MPGKNGLISPSTTAPAGPKLCSRPSSHLPCDGAPCRCRIFTSDRESSGESAKDLMPDWRAQDLVAGCEI